MVWLVSWLIKYVLNNLSSMVFTGRHGKTPPTGGKLTNHHGWPGPRSSTQHGARVVAFNFQLEDPGGEEKYTPFEKRDGWDRQARRPIILILILMMMMMVMMMMIVMIAMIVIMMVMMYLSICAIWDLQQRSFFSRSHSVPMVGTWGDRSIYKPSAYVPRRIPGSQFLCHMIQSLPQFISSIHSSKNK